MSLEINMGNCTVAPFYVKEGDISITKQQRVGGTITGPSVQYPLEKGTPVELDSEMTVKAYNDGLFIGFAYNEGKWVNGEAGIETIFKKIVTLTGKTSEGIAVKNYLVFHSDGTVKKSASSGSTATNMVALSAQDTNNRVVVGIL